MTAMVSVVSGGTVVQAQQFAGARDGKTVRISAIKGARYVLAEMHGGVAAGEITVKRVGSNLVVEQSVEGSDPESLIIEDFYGSDGQLVGLGANGEYLEYLVATEGAADAASLSDGASSLITLAAGSAAAMPNGFQFAEGGSSVFSSAFAGVAAVAGGFALSNNGGNGGGSSKAQPAPAARGGAVADEFVGAVPSEPGPAVGGAPAVVDAVVMDGGSVPESPAPVEDAEADTELAPEIADGKSKTRPNAILPDVAAKVSGAIAALSVDDIPVIEAVLDDQGLIQGIVADGGYTDDGRPQIVGKAEVGVLVHIYRGAELIGQVYADANGEWSFTPKLPLSNGRHAISILHEYPDGDVSEFSVPYVIFIDKSVPDAPVITGMQDDEGRIIGAITEGMVTDDNRPTIDGTAEAHATVIVYDKGKEIGRTQVGADGKWSFMPEPALADGLHILSYAAVDRAGNGSERTGVSEFVVDTRPEKINIYYADDDAGDATGEVFSGGVTDDSTPTLFGTATAGGIVKIYEGSTLLGEVVAGVDGTWQFTPSVALSEGAHSFHATVTLVAKGESVPSKVFKLEVDLTGPSEPTIEQVLDDVGDVQGPMQKGDTTDDAQPTLRGKAEANSTLIVRDGAVEIGRVLVNVQGDWTFTPEVALSVGGHSINVIAVDKAGNASAPSESFNFDVIQPAMIPAVAPTIDSIYDDVGYQKGLLGSGAVTDDDTPLVSGKGEPNSILVLKDNGVEIGRVTVDSSGGWSLLPSIPLSHGLHNLVATAVDEAGNVGRSSSIFGFKVAETGVGGALENFSTLKIEDPYIHSNEVVLPSGIVLTGLFGGAVSLANSGPTGGGMRPEDIYSALSFSGYGRTKIELPSESEKVSFFHILGMSSSCHVFYYDANGVQLGSTNLTRSSVGYQKNSFVAPEGSLIAWMEVQTSSASGVYIDSLQWGDRYPTGISISTAESDEFGGRIVYGTVSGIARLASDMLVQVSTDGGETWTDAVFSEGSWAAIQKDMPAGDWTAEVRIVDRSSGLSLGFSDSKLVLTQGAAAPSIERIADAEGMYTAAKAADGSLIEVSLDGTGAKQGDTVHIRWGTSTYDHVLTKANIDAGSATIRMPAAQILLQGVSSDFLVTAQVIGQNGTIGAVSNPYAVTGTYTVVAAAADTMYKDPLNNAYQGTGFKVTTDGVMTKTAVTASTHAGLTLSDASQQANALFTLDKPAREITLRLSGIDSELGVKIQIFDVTGKLIEEQTIHGDATAFHANAYTYTSKDELVDIGSFKITANEAEVTLDGFSRKDVTHTTDARDLNQISSSTKSFYGTDADDVVTLSMASHSYFLGATAGIHGGGGIDTLKITGGYAGSMLQGSNISSMEIIEITSSANELVRLNLSDVLRNGGTDIFYTGDKSRVQMMVKGKGTNVTLELYDQLIGGVDVSDPGKPIGGDLGDWVKKASVAIDGAVYDSYQHSTMAVEVLVQKTMTTTVVNRAEFIEPGVRSLRSGVLSDESDVHEQASLVQAVESELFGPDLALLESGGLAVPAAGATAQPFTGFASELLDQNQAMYVH